MSRFFMVHCVLISHIDYVLIIYHYCRLFHLLFNIYCYRYRGTVIGTRYGPGTGYILLDDVRCVGTETSIHNCPQAGWNDRNCDHSEDVSVSCGTSPVHYGNFHNVNVCRL